MELRKQILDFLDTHDNRTTLTQMRLAIPDNGGELVQNLRALVQEGAVVSDNGKEWGEPAYTVAKAPKRVVVENKNNRIYRSDIAQNLPWDFSRQSHVYDEGGNRVVRNKHQFFVLGLTKPRKSDGKRRYVAWSRLTTDDPSKYDDYVASAKTKILNELNTGRWVSVEMLVAGDGHSDAGFEIIWQKTPVVVENRVVEEGHEYGVQNHLRQFLNSMIDGDKEAASQHIRKAINGRLQSRYDEVYNKIVAESKR
jgi:hypothetical protein